VWSSTYTEIFRENKRISVCFLTGSYGRSNDARCHHYLLTGP
jgi:hypothetical protein